MLQNDHLIFEKNVVNRLLEVAYVHRKRIAICLDGKQYTYYELFSIAKKIANTIKGNHEHRCLILAKRNIIAYAGILGVLLSGKAYIFLNPAESIVRLRKIIISSNTRLIITDEKTAEIVSQLNTNLHDLLNDFCFYQEEEISKFNDNHEKNNYPAYSYRYAYIMFTSGSTGDPKGVPISHDNLNAFIDNIVDRIQPTKMDRFSQINELTFDFSVYDLFACWAVGACLCVLPENYTFGIAKYIQEHAITYWASVPSVVHLLQQLNRLQPNAFMSIQYSIFCGEALTADAAALWQQAAPNTVIDNLYGPTEATVAITGHLWKSSHDHDLIPIGYPFPNQGFFIITEKNMIITDDKIGELCLYGTQVSTEYWNNPKVSQERYIIVQGKKVYRTGDLVSLDAMRGLMYKGRIDDQFKIRGYRVEKLEVENTIKKLAQTNLVAIITIKEKAVYKVKSMYCMVSGTKKTEAELLMLCRKELPDYMIPEKIIKLDRMLYNRNGKIDYQELINLIEI